MISAIAAVRIPFETAAVLWITGRQAAQPIRCQKFPFHYIHNATGLFLWQHFVEQAYGENLVRTYGRIAHVPVHDIIEAAHRPVPKHLKEMLLRPVGHLLVMPTIGLAP